MSSATEMGGGYAHGRALVIAVANYGDINPLPEPVLNDARDMAAALSSAAHCGYDPRQVTVLLDADATLSAIRRELASLAAAANREETVFIYFSGHGARIRQEGEDSSLLLPFDCQRRDPLGTSLPEEEFSALLAAIPAGRLLVVLDACHSGGAGSLKADVGPGLRTGFAEKGLERLAQGAGRVIMASSRPDETSLVLHGARNSVFTEGFLEALKGGARTSGDGLIRVFEVFNHVAGRVRQAVPGRQHPVFKASDLEDNFPVALYLGGAKASDMPLAAAVPPPGPEAVLADLYPAGPVDDEIWSRAGGDVSRLRLQGTGRAMWFAALRTLRQGGGGSGISMDSLIQAALQDFPHHPGLRESGGIPDGPTSRRLA